MAKEQTNGWEEGMTEFERTSDFGTVLRGWINWYKQDGTDHGDLVIAEEAIIRKHNQVISQEKEKMIEEIKKDRLDMKIANIIYRGLGNGKSGLDMADEIINLLQNK